MADEPFLSRWSKRKTEARGGAPAEEVQGVPVAAPPPAAPAVTNEGPAPLPPVESLTPESDFTGFMRPDVDEGLKRKALKTLFQDPRYNEMDGLDVYVSDFSLPDPLPESWLGQLRAMARLGAYEEPVVEEGEKAPGDAPEAAPAPALEAAGKPLAGQGLAKNPSRDTSDTADGEPAAPPVPE